MIENRPPQLLCIERSLILEWFCHPRETIFLDPSITFSTASLGCSKTMNLLAHLVLLFCLIFTPAIALANEAKDANWIKTEAYEVAKKYAESISCEISTEEKNLVALTPWKNTGDDSDNRDEAKYALIWHGDIGCWGGSGTTRPQITIIRISTGNSFVVDPRESSPIVKFGVPAQYVKKIISSSPKSLTANAMDWGKNDAHCCASVEVKIQLRQDAKGNWRAINKASVPSIQPNPTVKRDAHSLP